MDAKNVFDINIMSTLPVLIYVIITYTGRKGTQMYNHLYERNHKTSPQNFWFKYISVLFDFSPNELTWSFVKIMIKTALHEHWTRSYTEDNAKPFSGSCGLY